MQRTCLSSIDIHSVGYDCINKILEIQFLSGGVFQYLKVPENIYLGFIKASSHDDYFDSYIKSVYSCKRVG